MESQRAELSTAPIEMVWVDTESRIAQRQHLVGIVYLQVVLQRHITHTLISEPRLMCGRSADGVGVHAAMLHYTQTCSASAQLLVSASNRRPPELTTLT